ncbi:hypothetical protein [Phaeobacter inhibens]|uniref:hypothetical protein n=1 Tax=Phaeobacter inhibens TaxID=221822 RepID=UPI0021A45EC8|nr:hypothetical protein [Phaeobacter inhibens]UWR46855.1 hypothetical protein K4F86_08805 [Phaeobacter inhibens]
MAGDARAAIGAFVSIFGKMTMERGGAGGPFFRGMERMCAVDVASIGYRCQPKAVVDQWYRADMLLVQNFMVPFPEADARKGRAASRDAAGCTGVTKAQEAGFAKH